RYGLYGPPDAAAIVRAIGSRRRPNGPIVKPWLSGDHAAFWWTDPLPGIIDAANVVRRRVGGGVDAVRARGRRYLTAIGLTGDPTAPVIGSGGAENRNS